MEQQLLDQNLPSPETTETETRDLGFGAVVTRASRQRLLNHIPSALSRICSLRFDIRKLSVIEKVF
ncbi:MAG: hypothetical protein M3Q26_07330 [Acidobacteriota bacterium]|nr:hypothetical protein [Acidobacteriota bacterium]